MFVKGLMGWVCGLACLKKAEGLWVRAGWPACSPEATGEGFGSHESLSSSQVGGGSRTWSPAVCYPPNDAKRLSGHFEPEGPPVTQPVEGCLRGALVPLQTPSRPPAAGPCGSPPPGISCSCSDLLQRLPGPLQTHLSTGRTPATVGGRPWGWLVQILERAGPGFLRGASGSAGASEWICRPPGEVEPAEPEARQNGLPPGRPA